MGFYGISTFYRSFYLSHYICKGQFNKYLKMERERGDSRDHKEPWTNFWGRGIRTYSLRNEKCKISTIIFQKCQHIFSTFLQNSVKISNCNCSYTLYIDYIDISFCLFAFESMKRITFRFNIYVTERIGLGKIDLSLRNVT